jgi:amidase
VFRQTPLNYQHGLLEGQPYGVTFSAGAYSEPLLVEVAFAFEQLTGHRRPPVL